MSMQRIYLGATVDVANLKDAYEALSMVDGLEIVTTAPARERRGSRLNREPVRRVAPVKKASAKYGNPRVKDPRAVFFTNGQLDIPATLRRMGLSKSQLMAMETKMGTLEYSVKRSLLNFQREIEPKLGQLKNQLGELEVAA